MKRAIILSQCGPPDLKRTLLKTAPAIWGTIEDFWSGVPMGAKVEIWLYKSQAQLEEGSSNLTAGTTELYFVNGSASVDGIGFAPEGVVYEAGGS
jgi:hypothetical protein